MTPYRILAAGFLGILAAAAVADLVARRHHRGLAPLVTALTAALRTPAGRVVVLGAWVWIGFHFLAR
jgi:hypothetical protein